MMNWGGVTDGALEHSRKQKCVNEWKVVKLFHLNGGYYMKKIIISFLLVISMIAAMIIPAFATDFAKEDSISLHLTMNKNLTEEVNPNEQVLLTTEDAEDNTELIFTIRANSSDPVVADLALPWDGRIYNITMEGSVETISAGNYMGNVGTFFGEIIKNGVSLPVCLNITYTESGSIISLSIGAASEDSTPCFMVFGEFTDAITAINLANAEKRGIEAHSVEAHTNSESDIMPLSDNSIYYQNSAVMSSDGYNLGAIALYSAKNVGQGLSSSVYGKVNSNCANVRSYLVNTQSLVSSLIYDVYPIKVNITLGSNNKYYGSTETFSPIETTTSQTVTVPFYTATLGWQTFSVTYKLSSVTITKTKLSGAPKNTAIKWDIYKKSGWGDDLDGNLSTISSNESGMAVYTQYQYEGSLSSGTQVNVTMKATGFITYEYQYVTTGGMLPFSFATSTKSAQGITTVTGS